MPSASELLDRLGGVSWPALALALALHVTAIGARSRAWRTILAHDFPEAAVSGRGIFGAFAAGVGANSILPARLGDVLKLFLARRQVPGSSYPTLISSLFVIALLDSVIALGFVLWAISAGELPGFATLVSDAGSLGERVSSHPGITTAVALLLASALVVALRFARRKLSALRAGFLRGLTVLRDWRLYLLHVVPWQGLSWALQLGAFWCFLRAFGLPASLENAVLVQAVQSLAIAVPLTASGAGAEQALLLLAFAGEAGTGTLLAFAVGMRLALIAANVVLGGLAVGLLLRTLRLRTILRAESDLLEHLKDRLGFRLAARLRRATR
jgi:uncharacterized membrane protein YbhN (UPF0104 family)